MLLMWTCFFLWLLPKVLEYVTNCKEWVELDFVKVSLNGWQVFKNMINLTHFFIIDFILFVELFEGDKNQFNLSVGGVNTIKFVSNPYIQGAHL